MFESLNILAPLVLLPLCVVVGFLVVLALTLYVPFRRKIATRWPRLHRNLHLVVPIVAFCVVAFLLFAAVVSRGSYQQYWLDEPLCIAAGDGDMVKVEDLLDKGASPDAWGIDYVSRALIDAASQGHSDVVVLLIEHGADVNARNMDGNTALDAARESDHDDIVRLLIDAGAHAD
jgi:hypothetical protein